MLVPGKRSELNCRKPSWCLESWRELVNVGNIPPQTIVIRNMSKQFGQILQPPWISFSIDWGLHRVHLSINCHCSSSKLFQILPWEMLLGREHTASQVKDKLGRFGRGHRMANWHPSWYSVSWTVKLYPQNMALGLLFDTISASALFSLLAPLLKCLPEGGARWSHMVKKQTPKQLLKPQEVGRQSDQGLEGMCRWWGTTLMAKGLWTHGIPSLHL